MRMGPQMEVGVPWGSGQAQGQTGMGLSPALLLLS